MPSSSSPLDAGTLQDIAEFFKVFSEPTRLAILQELREGPLCVTDITERLPTSQANISKQLKHLHQAGLLARQRTGNEVHYQIAEPLVFELCKTVCDRLEERTGMTQPSRGFPHPQ